MPLEFAGPGIRLQPADIDAEAAELGCPAAAVHAVLDVETAGGGFLPDQRPKILFEAHVFSRVTGHRWDRQYPNISAPVWNRALYGAGGAHQYARLAFAIALDRGAALQAASWGLAQILGLNFAICGFPDVEALVAAMIESERRQLDAFAAFCRHQGLDRDLRRDPPDFAHFAERYNGPGQVAHYSAELRAAFAKWQRISAVPAPRPNSSARTGKPAIWHAALRLGSIGSEVAELKRRLNLAGIEPPLALSGPGADRFDADTDDAVRAFQKDRGLAVDGWAGPATWQALPLPA
jgi:hypothetical protein